MKYIVGVLMAVCFVLAFATAHHQDRKTTAEALPPTGSTTRVTVYTDPETQCEYLVTTGDSKGITVRLGTDGFPLCANQKDTGK